MNTPKRPIETALRETADLIERALDDALSPEKIGYGATAEAMHYSTLGGGKRIRAYLTLAFCALCGGRVEDALPFACAVECVHAYSLIHDDLPAMDNDAMRRGKPSCHIAYGEATALLAGDALLTYAFELTSGNRRVSAESARLATHVLASEAGARGMVGGQTLDMQAEFETIDELTAMVDGKTAALIRAACFLGVYAATDSPDPDLLRRVRRYADAVGLGFQIRDDILDVTGDTATLGKEVGSDAKNDKKTVLAFRDLDEARLWEASLVREAEDALDGLPGSGELSELARWLSRRNK